MTAGSAGGRRPQRGSSGAAVRPRRSEKKALCRARILESARVVFFRDGFMTANLDEVAERAEVAKGTLYRYFESKADLYVAVLSQDGRLFEDRLRATVTGDVAPPEQVRRTARFYFEHWIRNREYFPIFWALENQAVIGEIPPVVVEEVTKLWEGCLRILADVIAGGVRDGSFRDCDSWEVANILWTLANGLIQSEHAPSRRRLRRRRLDRVFDDAIELVLRGLAPPAKSRA
ncbi:MAG: TetR/AcrR family transcriptional regulator [Deltaproteobacteria bacterium]|nr:TetR/AcrR family transcriptional regulator [Deltaproteobacteria bacterium]